MGASESKLTFKEDVFRLAREDNIPADSGWWAQFYQLPETADDVFALWSPNDVRNLTLNNAAERPPPGMQTAPKRNLETLIYICVSRLQSLQSRRVYSDPHHPITHEALNCIRILTRLQPYIYEAEHLLEWEDAFFWQKRKPQRILDVEHSRHPTEAVDGLNPSKKLAENMVLEQGLAEPLGELLIDLLVRYMFFPAFTLPKKLDKDGLPDLKVQYHIWNSGIGCRQSVGMTKENERNAAEVLRLLLALCSRQCYISPHVVAETNTKALTFLTTQLDRQVALSMICSLMNTVLKYNPAAWRVPIDMSLGPDAKPSLVTLSLQLIDVLLLYSVPDGEINAFRKALSRLHRAEDFQFIQQGITLVLTQPVSGVSSYLPGNQKMISWAPEALILFWELLQSNKRFRSFIIDTDRAHDLTVLIFYYAMDAKDEPSKQGIVRMCVLILQTLSVETSFGMRLNKPFIAQETLPQVLRISNFHGSYADFLITSIHKLMTTTQGRLESIYPALLAIINNIAPHVRDLQRATSSKLLELFVSMSSPKYLLEKDGNYVTLFSLLEAMNAILEHQFEANRRFVEVVVRSRKRFRALRDFTIEGALAELDRQAQARKERATGDVPSGVRSPVRNGSMDSLRSPVASARSPALGNVPEDGTFAIGDDDEDDETDGSRRESREEIFSASHSASPSVVEEAVPLQSRSMSEKARGKQPVGQDSFSRSTSRNTSSTSLPSLTTHLTNINANTTNASQHFTPTPEWLDTWLPHLPLHTILTVLDQNGHQFIQSKEEPTKVPASTSQHTSGFAGEHTTAGRQKQAAEELAGGHTKVSTGPAAEISTALKAASPNDAPEAKVQAFQWTPLSLGWYLSLLWGAIYASDVATHKGLNGIWTGTGIRLFNIQSRNESISLRSPKGAVDYVGDSIARRLGSISFSSTSMREV